MVGPRKRRSHAMHVARYLCCASTLEQLGTEDEAHRGTDPGDMGAGLDFVSLGSNRTTKDIGCGQHHCCAVLDDGSLKCWGWNKNGM